MTARKHIGVVIQARDVARVREALRAAVGLSLRDDAVTVHIDPGLLAAGDPAIDRAVGTLRQLGHTVNGGDLRACDAVEVWT